MHKNYLSQKTKQKKNWNNGYTVKFQKSKCKMSVDRPSSSASRRSCDSHSRLPGSLLIGEDYADPGDAVYGPQGCFHLYLK